MTRPTISWFGVGFSVRKNPVNPTILTRLGPSSLTLFPWIPSLKRATTPLPPCPPRSAEFPAPPPPRTSTIGQIRTRFPFPAYSAYVIPSLWSVSPFHLSFNEFFTVENWSLRSRVVNSSPFFRQQPYPFTM